LSEELFGLVGLPADHSPASPVIMSGTIDDMEKLAPQA